MLSDLMRQFDRFARARRRHAAAEGIDLGPGSYVPAYEQYAPRPLVRLRSAWRTAAEAMGVR